MADFGDRAQATSDLYHGGAMASAKMNGGAGRAFCEDCDVKLSRARRQAMPSATRCVECQQEWEGCNG